MAWEAWVTLGVLAAMVVVLLTERVVPVVCVGVSVLSLYLMDVIEFGEAFSGFSNSAPITVAALYIVAGAAEQTGALARALGTVLGARKPRSARSAVLRVSSVSAVASGGVPNTPLVALLIPTIESWARRHGISPSRLLMPLSFAAVLGGVVTLLGTSTNLVVSGLLEDAGMEPLGVFTITPVGLPVAMVGVVILVWLAPILLRQRTTPAEALPESREYTIDMVVTARSNAQGRTLVESGLNAINGLRLQEIERLGEIIAPQDSTTIEAGDHLIFAGQLGHLSDLKDLDGIITTYEHLTDDPGEGGAMFEVVVSGTGPLVGHTLTELAFGERHGAVVIALHRAGEAVSGRIGDVRLRGGDVLVVVAESGFRDRTRDLPDFLVVAPLDETPPIRRPGAKWVQLVVAVLVAVTGSGLVDLPRAAVASALAVVVLGVMSPSDARRAVNFDVIALVALSFGLGAAAGTSGLATEIANGLSSAGEPFGDIGVLAAIMLATLVLTELITNNAAAAIMFPVALATAAETGLDPRSLAIGVLVMASCSFLSPIGYQTNTMVWNIGGYRFGDFTRLGIPLTLSVFATTLAMVPLAFPLS